MNPLTDRLHRWWKIDTAGFIAAALLTAAAFMLGFKPMLDHQARQFAQRRQAAQDRRQLDELRTTLQTLRLERERVRLAIARSNIRLQPVDQLNAHVTRVAELAAACGLEIHEVEPGETVGYEHYDAAPIRLTGEGSYPACALLMHRLRTTFPDTAVDAVELTGRPQTPDAPTTFRFTLTWHAAPDTDSGIEQRAP